MCIRDRNTTIDAEIKAKIDAMDTSSLPPVQEPERQYYFLKKAKELVQAKSEELGRPLTACTTTFGCQDVYKRQEQLTAHANSIAVRFEQKED